MIAISTSWNAERTGGWAPAVRELLRLGHKFVALDGGALHGDAAAAGSAARESKGRVLAVFAPAPREDRRGAPSPTLASPAAATRKLAVTAACRVADSAIAAGTQRVILRVGRPATLLQSDRERVWAERIQAEGVGDVLRADIRATVTAERGTRERAMESVCRSLADLIRARPEVHWLLETPAEPTALPLPDEAETVLAEFPGKRVGYWHDSGHAARLAALGLSAQDEWLGRLAPVAAGVTLADWSPIADRMPPGSGSVQWRALRFQMRENMSRVLALDPEYPAALIQDTLREAGNLGF